MFSQPLAKIVSTAGLALALATATMTAEAAPSEVECSTDWGSLAEQDPTVAESPSHLTGVRSGSHDCFDRLVLDLDGETTGYIVGYVDEVLASGSGELIDVDGGARLAIHVLAPAHDDDFQATYSPADPTELVDVDGYPTLRQVAFGGSFEGETLIGAGVRGRLPFRAFVLDGPGNNSRLVIDVAHTW